MTQTLPAFTVSCPSCRSEFPVDPEKVPVRGIHAICSTCMRVFRVERPEGYVGVDEVEGPWSAEEESVEALEAAAALDLPVEPVAAEVAGELDEFHEIGAFDETETDDLEIAGFAEGGDAADVLDDVEVFGEIEVVEEVVEEIEVVEVEVTDEVAAAPPEPPSISTPAPPAPAQPVAPSVAAAPSAPPAPPTAPPQPKQAQAIVDLSSLAQEAIAEGTGELGKAQLAGSSLSLGADRFRKRGPQERAQRLARVLVSDIIAYYPARYRESFQRGTLKEDFQDEVRKSWKEYVDQVGLELAESTPYFGEALNEILGQGQQIFGPPAESK